MEERQEVEAPVDVTYLPYYSPSWKFVQQGESVEVDTDIYRDDEGREVGMTVCTLTWQSFGPSVHITEDVTNVMILGSDGGPLAHRAGGGICERG